MPDPQLDVVTLLELQGFESFESIDVRGEDFYEGGLDGRPATVKRSHGTCGVCIQVTVARKTSGSMLDFDR